MSVHKRPGSKYYWTKFELNGKRIHKSTKTTNLTKGPAMGGGAQDADAACSGWFGARSHEEHYAPRVPPTLPG